VGTARTALFNWLFARQEGGTFILRIEDTDSGRSRAEHTAGIERAMRWLGLDWDEGPYFQSERGSHYAAAIERLIASGAVYGCDCTPDAIAARAAARRGAPGYDGFCRDRGLDTGPGRILRFCTPDEGSTSYHDVIRGSGTLTQENRGIEDFGVRKSNGDPLFLLANVVDDAEMAITHVIRGEDHVSNTFKYALLWDALDYGPRPTFAHLPLLHNEAHKKLSKRRDKVAVEDYRHEGYLPDAVVNYLALLGWSPKADREVLTRAELIDQFRLEDVKSSPAVFDLKKMAAVNAEYLRALSPGEFVEAAQAWLQEQWEALAPLVQTRVRTLGEVYLMVDFLYLAEPVIDDAQWAKERRRQPAFVALLGAAAGAYAETEWDAETIKEATVAAAATVGVEALGKAQAPIRLAVTGRSVGPPLFESLERLGRERVIARVRSAQARAEQEDAGAA
jgi:glutamyl-tRNA synthetase